MIGVLSVLMVMIFDRVFPVITGTIPIFFKEPFRLLLKKCTILFCIAISILFSMEHFLITIKRFKIFKDRLIRKDQFLFSMYTKNLRLRGNLQRREKKWKVGIFLKWRLLSDLLAREKL